MSNKYIHYGCSNFDINFFDPIHNCSVPWIKPFGGLWGSPVECKGSSWKDFCISENFDVDRLGEYFYFSIKPEAKGMVIKSTKDIETKLNPYIVSNLFGDSVKAIDFEALMSAGYDYMYVEMNSSDLYFALYGWDCTSVVVFQPDCIVLE